MSEVSPLNDEEVAEVEAFLGELCVKCGVHCMKLVDVSFSFQHATRRSHFRDLEASMAGARCIEENSGQQISIRDVDVFLRELQGLCIQQRAEIHGIALHPGVDLDIGCRFANYCLGVHLGYRGDAGVERRSVNIIAGIGLARDARVHSA